MKKQGEWDPAGRVPVRVRSYGTAGPLPLGVAVHVADLHAVVSSRCEGRVPLVGHSWGAMLALAHSARHPDRVSCLVLVACGAFDWSSRESLREERERRMDLASRRRLDDLARDHPDPDDRLEAMAALLLPIYSHDLVTTDQEVESFDMQGHEETWSDMVRIQETGVYPDAFAAIDAPILMLHGTIDPHPGRMIRDSLARHVGRLEYREWKRCGHFPWMERAVREEFFAVLIGWLRRHAGGGS